VIRVLRPLCKSVLHNIGVVAVGLGLALIGTRLDSRISMPKFTDRTAKTGGLLLLTAGFSLRVWATFYFYHNDMKVISLTPQRRLITSGPYRFSRNPLYLGGNVFIFSGAASLLGSPAALLVTVLHIPLIDLFIRREERQLAREFGEEWVQYRSRVPRWI